RFENGLPHSMIWDVAVDRGSTTLSVWTRGRGAYVWPLPSGAIPAPTLTNVKSMKDHAGAGTLYIDLPLVGTRGVECRNVGHLPGGATGDYQLIFTFANNLLGPPTGTAVAHDPASGSGTVTSTSMGPA